MKKLLYCILSSFVTLCVHQSLAQGVAINADGSLPDNSAVLDLKHSSKGVLLPRLSQAQRNQVTNPATGLLVYQTDNQPGFYYYNGSGWSPVTGANTIYKKGWDFSYSQPNGAGIETNGTIYRMVSRFVYRGTTLDGLINSVAAICYTNNAAVSYQVRLYDYTNAVVIAESAASNSGTNANPTVIAFNMIANLPATTAIFEIQMRATGAGSSVGMHSLQLFQ